MHVPNELCRLLDTLVKHVLNHIAVVDPVNDQRIDGLAHTPRQLLPDHLSQLPDLVFYLLANGFKLLDVAHVVCELG